MRMPFVLLDQGKEVWRQTLPSQVFTAPLIAGGRVFVLAADRSVSALTWLPAKSFGLRQEPVEMRWYLSKVV